MLLVACFVLGLWGSLARAGPSGRSLCPFGTFTIREGSEVFCYKFIEDRLTFQEAEEECQFRWRGYLASIKKDREAKSLSAYVAKENLEKNYVWIGLRREEGSSMTNGWRWTDGTRSTYRRWNYGEPNNLNKNELCVALTPSSGFLNWVDTPCGQGLSYLCRSQPR